MARFATPLLLGLLCLPASPLYAADNPAAGTWKFSFIVPSQQGPAQLGFLLMLSETDKGWVGDFLGASQQLGKEPTFEKVTVQEDHVQFSLKFGPGLLSFDGRIAKDGKKIPGTFEIAGQSMLVELLPSKLKNLTDAFALSRENLDVLEGGQEYFDALFAVLGKAAAKKMKAEDVRVLTDKATKIAEKYGPRWQRVVLLRMASILAGEEGFAAIALEQARQAERMLKPEDDLALQIQVLDALASVLRKAKKIDELKPLEARILKLETRDYLEYAKANPIKAEEFKGRKAKSDRAVLVEFFTGVDSEACVSMELAFDALLNTYKPSEVVLIEYHIPFNGFDTLMLKEGIERLRAYKDKQPGPSMFINGKKDETAAGPRGAAKLKYTAYREAIDEWLEKPAPVKLQLSASQKGNDVSIKAVVGDLQKPGENITLRFVLVEDRIRYSGTNGTRYQHAVVRSFPGGLKGFALTKKDAEHAVTVNLDALREELNKQLDELTMGEAELATSPRPMGLKNLRAVAIVQDDASGEVLQAAQVELEEKKE